MAMQTLSLAAIIAESQQGEQAARRAAPAARSVAGIELDALPAPKPPEKARDTGQAATIEDQQRLDQEAEDKKKALEDAKKSTLSAADSLQTIQQLDYTQTFLKIFGLA